MAFSKGQVLEAVAPASHWCDELDCWLSIETGDVGIVESICPSTYTAYKVLMLRRGVVARIGTGYAHNITRWRSK